MASNQTLAILVARYLKANHYNKTLAAFLLETNLDDKDAITKPGDWTLEKLLEEKIQFDTSLNFERRDQDNNQGWTKPAPSIPREPEISVTSNVLCIKGSHPLATTVAISTANNTCNFIQTRQPYAAQDERSFKIDSPILSTVFFAGNYVASTGMSGKVVIHNVNSGQLVGERRDHGKWAVHIASWQDPTDSSRFLIATAGWDQKVNLYALQCDASQTLSNLDPPAHSIELPSNPESLAFVTNPDTNNLYLIISRRDSTFLYYYRIDSATEPSNTQQPPKPHITMTPAGRQNLAPHSNAWVAFTPSALALHPTDPTLLAIATSHLPHLKVIIVRLLFPEDTTLRSGIAPQTAAAVARADLALQDREDAAITLQVSTQAPQTPYSTPQVVWRPDGSGVWVNGDDGVVRGVEARSGKVVALLRAHEVGSKVRTLWAGYVESGDGERREVVISGGFDRKVFVWEVDMKEQE
ncbi:hypothetical protein LTR64_007527 [Lithohypha guttulata]|uniref:uncharacterized protein n=1 Tax=Lithohypha guttulata TaxID=1690604 RepID=UPI002DE0960D|nr:hypothetical protein LTR51_007037 [Lithohypha guttulata]